MSRWFFGSGCLVLILAGQSFGVDPCKSGLTAGLRPGPYSALVATGPQRGQPHCFICETGDKPAIVIFARDLSEPLGKFVHRLDKALAEHKAAELRAWVTFLNTDPPAFDPKVVRWGQQHAIRSVPLGIFSDTEGPPSYRLGRDADLTVLFFVKQKVVANFAFRAGELNEERVGEMLKVLPRIVEGK